MLVIAAGIEIDSKPAQSVKQPGPIRASFDPGAISTLRGDLHPLKQCSPRDSTETGIEIDWSARPANVHFPSSRRFEPSSKRTAQKEKLPIKSASKAVMLPGMKSARAASSILIPTSWAASRIRRAF
jgi:hypothetical protein